MYPLKIFPDYFKIMIFILAKSYWSIELNLM